MRSYICLLLDKDCHVVVATVLRGTLAEITEAAERLNDERETRGYEVWADDRRIITSYDCAPSPGRVRVHSHA